MGVTGGLQINLMIKFSKFRIFLLLLVSLIVIYYFSNEDFKHIDSKKDLISFLNLNKDRILNFEDKIHSDGLSDSNFYADAWVFKTFRAFDEPNLSLRPMATDVFRLTY